MTIELRKDFFWHRALPIPGQDAARVRKDYAGAIIHWDEYEQDSMFGWTIVPLVPYSKGGDDNWMSMLPYHMKNALAKGDDYPCYQTVLSSCGLENISKVQKWDVMRLL
ncbi:HNH nuclease [gut metagenome]|uniref:HNH nuclease n=1 Tax=gut metagenome TaxID=749906 RepID=J9F4X4_9ZZZZ